MAYAARAGMKRFVVVDGQGKQYDRIEKQSLIFSPDSRRMACVSRGVCQGRHSVVVDGQVGKFYDRIGKRSLVFSPDSQRVGYVATVLVRILGLIKVDQRSMLVVDGLELSQYDAIVAPPEKGGAIFDSPDQLHYIARKGSAFYLVEERLA